MSELDKLRAEVEARGYSQSYLSRKTGLSRPTIFKFFSGGDMMMSTVERIRGVLTEDEPSTTIGNVNGDCNAIAAGRNAKATVSRNSDVELAELRIKCELQAQLLKEKDAIISLLNQQLALHQSKDA